MTLLDVVRARERLVRASTDRVVHAVEVWATEASHDRARHLANERGMLSALTALDSAKVALKAAEALRERADATGDSLCECVTSEAGAHLARECRRTVPATEGAAT